MRYPDDIIPTVMLHTRGVDRFTIICRMNPGDRGPFPILDLGDYFTLYPTLEQLAAIRDVITAFLTDLKPANADLTTAAADLLAALTAIRDSAFDGRPCPDWLMERLDAALPAMQKAEGRGDSKPGTATASNSRAENAQAPTKKNKGR